MGVSKSLLVQIGSVLIGRGGMQSDRMLHHMRNISLFIRMGGMEIDGECKDN